MVCVGIDVAKDKHDCCILDSDGTIRADCITIPNNMDGFKQLLQTIRDCTKKSDKIKVGLEATGSSLQVNSARLFWQENCVFRAIGSL